MFVSIWHFIPPPDEMMEDKKAVVVSGLKIVLHEQSLRVSPSLAV